MQEIKGSSSITGLEMVGNTLRVRFKRGATYEYEDVGVETMNKMLQADSVGEFFAREIRPNFTGVPVDDEPTNQEETTSAND